MLTLAVALRAATVGAVLGTDRAGLAAFTWVIKDHLRPSGHIMPDVQGDRGAARHSRCLTITTFQAKADTGRAVGGADGRGGYRGVMAEIVTLTLKLEP